MFSSMEDECRAETRLEAIGAKLALEARRNGRNEALREVLELIEEARTRAVHQHNCNTNTYEDYIHCDDLKAKIEAMLNGSNDFQPGDV